MGLFFAFIGLMILVIAYVIHAMAQTRGKRAALWPTVTGTVVSGEVGVAVTAGGQMMTPVITYAYEVAGQKLQSTRLRVGVDPRFNSPAKVQAVIDKYPAGGQVIVHYDSADPSVAALDLTVGETYGPLYVAAFGGTLLVLGVVIAFMGV